MLRTFLVEDEIVVRETIKKMIPWEQYGYELVGEAPDGEVALPMIKNLKPDLLITDIKMPFMDGLTLCRMVRKDFPEMKIVILSCDKRKHHGRDPESDHQRLMGFPPFAFYKRHYCYAQKKSGKRNTEPHRNLRCRLTAACCPYVGRKGQNCSQDNTHKSKNFFQLRHPRISFLTKKL